MNLITAPSGRVPPFNSQFKVNSAFGLYHLAVTVTSPVEPFAIVSTGEVTVTAKWYNPNAERCV